MKFYLFLTMLFVSLSSNAAMEVQGSNPLSAGQFNVATGVSSLSLTFKNTGSAPDSVSSVLSGSNASEFKVSLNRCNNVAPNKTCQITVSSQRSISVGSKSFLIGGVTVLLSIVKLDSQGNDISNPAAVENVSFSVESLPEIQFLQNELSRSVGISVKNTGNLAVTPSLSWIVNSASVKMVINRCSSLLAPGKSCSVTFKIPAVSTQTSQTLQALVSSSMKDELVFNIKPYSLPQDPELQITFAEGTSFKLYSGSGGVGQNPLFSGNQSGARSFSLPQGSYTLLMEASQSSVFRRYLSNPDSCSLILDDERLSGKPGYSCPIVLGSSNLVKDYSGSSQEGMAILISHENEDLHGKVSQLDLNYLDEASSESGSFSFNLSNFPEGKILATLNQTDYFFGLPGTTKGTIGFSGFTLASQKLTLDSPPSPFQVEGPFISSSLSASTSSLSSVSNFNVFKLKVPLERRTDINIVITDLSNTLQYDVDTNILSQGESTTFDISPFEFGQGGENPKTIIAPAYLDLNNGNYALQAVGQSFSPLGPPLAVSVECSAPSDNYSLSTIIIPMFFQIGPNQFITIWSDQQTDGQGRSFSFEMNQQSFGFNTAFSLQFQHEGLHTLSDQVILENDLSCSFTFLQF